MKKLSYMKKNTSFTLIELLVVIVIIGVLAGVIIVTTTSSISNATLARAKAFSSNIQNSMLLNLVSEWTFDEPEEVGRTTKDSWGINNGTVTESIHYNGSNGECVFGGCYYFDGSNDYINVGSNNLPTTGELTISAWIKSSSNITNIKNVIGKLYFSEISYGIQIDNYNSLCAKYYNSSSTPFYVYGGTISPNEFYYIVTTYIPNTTKNAKIYVNGIFKDDETITGTLGVHSYVFIGGAYTERFFNGYIDDVRIYNAALSSSQIKQNYIAGLNSLLSKGQISKEEYNQKLSELALK